MRQTRSAISLIFGFAAFVLAGRAENSLADRWRAMAEDASGRVGVAALMVASGQSASMDGSAHFPMQSVYKLPISMAVLEKVDQGQLSLDQGIEVRPDQYVPQGKHSPPRDQFPHGTKKSIRDVIAYALVESDGTASDALLRLAGGPQAVTSYLRSLAVTEMVIANSEMEMDWKTQYNNWSTPEAALEILENLQSGKSLSAESRALVLDDMQNLRPVLAVSAVFCLRAPWWPTKPAPPACKKGWQPLQTISPWSLCPAAVIPR